MATTKQSIDITKSAPKKSARQVKKSTNQWKLVGKRIKNNKVAVIALYYILFNILIAGIYPLLISNHPTSTAPGKDGRYGGGAPEYPTLKYPAGTTINGMDSFSRLLAGAETSIIVGVLSTLISIVIGVTVGLYAGYYQGKIEEILMRITDLFLAVPFLIIALILIQLINLDQETIISSFTHIQIITILIGAFGWAGLARLVNSSTKQIKSYEYIDAVRIMGAKDSRVIYIHILPNILSPIIVLAAIFVAGGILSEAGLAFLGFGDPVNTVSWGIQVNQAQDRLIIHPEQALIPGFAIFFLVLAINLFGDALTDALNPRLRD